MADKIDELLQSIKTELDAADDFVSLRRTCSLISRLVRLSLRYTLVDFLEIIPTPAGAPDSLKVMDFSMDRLRIPYDGQPASYGLIGWCVRDRRAKLVQGIQSKPEKLVNVLRSEPSDHLPFSNYYPYLPDTDTELVVPIKADDVLLGVINVESNDVSRELLSDYPLVQEIADYVGHSILRVTQFHEPHLIRPEVLIKQERYKHLRTHVQSFLDRSPFERNAFILMRLSDKYRFKDIERIVKATLKKHNLNGFTAKDFEYIHSLWDNICVYMASCKYAVAIIEDIEGAGFNPNIILELGFMDAWGREVLVLKDEGVSLFSDINYRLYQNFNSEERDTIDLALTKWLEGKAIRTS